MFALDMRTEMLGFAVTNFFCAIVIIGLWLQNRRHFSGLSFLAFNFSMQALGTMLICFRGILPDFVTMVIANSLIMSGAIAGLMGLERFLGLRRNNLAKIVLLCAFIVVQFYFSIIQDNLTLRNLAIAVSILLVSMQCAWILLSKKREKMPLWTVMLGVAYIGYCFLNVLRIGAIFIKPSNTNDMMSSGPIDVLVILTYETLIILLTFSWFLMVQQRLWIALKKQDEKFSWIFQFSPDAKIITRVSDGLVVDVNEEFMLLSGYQRHEVINNTSVFLRFWENADQRLSILQKLILHKRVTNEESIFRRKSGELFYGLFSAGVITIGDSQLVVSSIRDITDRKKSEESLQASEARWRLLLETLPDYVGIHDVSGRFVYLNHYADGFSYDDFKDRYFDDFVAPGSKEAFRLHFKKCIENKKVLFAEHEAAGTHGSICSYEDYFVPIQNNGVVDNVMVISRDITARKRSECEKKQLEEQLRQSQKLESIGLLAGGIAHDFNNILGGIVCFAEILKIHCAQLPDSRNFAEKIIDASMTASQVIRQLLMFARKSTVDFCRIDLHMSISNAVLMLEHSFPENITIKTTLGASESEVFADQATVENMCLNLGINARDAMPSGGVLHFKSEVIHLDEVALNQLGYVNQAGKFIKISVIDNGTGIDAITQQRVFEPFFTTKECGKGTGLGLASVHGCVQQNKGHIYLESAVGKGTTFFVLFPLAIG